MKNQQDQLPIYAQAQGFSPASVGSSNAGVQQNNQRTNNVLAQNLAQLERNSRVEQANLKRQADDYIALGQFSQNLLSKGLEIYKAVDENNQMNATFDAMFGGQQPDSPQEVQDDKTLAEIDRTNADAAAETENTTGSAETGEMVRTATPSGQAIQPYRVERANLTQAQISYAPFMSAYLQGNATFTVGGQKMSVREAIASGDPALISAALASGRVQFYRQFGLSGYSRRRVVKALGGTITNTDSQFMAGSVNAAIKAKREAAQAQLAGQSYEIGRTAPITGLGDNFQTLAASAWASGAFSTRGEANAAVVKGMLNGMIARGDVTAIEALERVQKVPGQAGSELRTIDPALFDEAKAKAAKGLEERVSQTNKDIRNQMFKDLRGAKTQQERDAIIERAATELEKNGDYEAARGLRQDRDDLVVEGGADYNAAQLEQQIRNGEITTPAQIEEQRLLGRITDADAKSLTQMLGANRGAEKPKNKTAASVVTDFGDRTKLALLQAFGLKKDVNGNYVAALNGSPLVRPEDAEIIIGQAQRDLNIVANQLLETNPGLANDPIALQRELNRELSAWTKENLYTQGGKFFIQDVLDLSKDANKLPIYTQQMRGRFTNLLSSPGVMSRPQVPRGSASRPVDWSDSGVVDGIVLPSTRQRFNPLRGDKLFTQQDLEQELKDFQAGNPSPRLQRFADALGMSPLALLQQQSSAYSLPMVTAPSSSTGSASAPLTSVQGAQQLMARGLPVRGASWLAGNIQQESSWRGNRTWDDGGSMAGGVVSWRGDRLEALQQRYGKPISQITTAQQLDFMVDELKTNYPDAWRIFNNPMSSDRQLIRASKMFWGYGVEGERYSYARATERQLTGRQSTRSASTIQAAAATYKGADTSTGPDGGNNACVWAINNALKAAGISPPWGDSLYVPYVKNVLDKKGTLLSAPQPGAIAIMRDNGNPPYPHIGIVQADGRIISNSSSRARFDWVGTEQDYTNRYGRTPIYYAL